MPEGLQYPVDLVCLQKEGILSSGTKVRLKIMLCAF